jgi:hypothetical protein
VIVFEKALQYCEVIVCCYNKQITIRISVCVRTPFTWRVAQIVVDVLSPCSYAHVY